MGSDKVMSNKILPMVNESPAIKVDLNVKGFQSRQNCVPYVDFASLYRPQWAFFAFIMITSLFRPHWPFLHSELVGVEVVPFLTYAKGPCLRFLRLETSTHPKT